MKKSLLILLLFAIASFTIIAQPANDNCSGAIALTAGTQINGDVTNATQTIAGCSGNASHDVWYSFTPSSTGSYSVSCTGSSGFDAVIDFRTGACNGVSSSCINATGLSGNESSVVALNSGTTYYFRIYDFNGTPTTNTFTIIVYCVGTTAPTIPTSDSPQCHQVTISTSGNAPTGVTWYWQGINPNGISISNNAITSYTTATSGTYYLRAKDNTSSCWSTNSTNIAVIVNSFSPLFTSTQSLGTAPVATFNNTTSNIANYNFTWDFGDGTTINSNNSTITHSFTNTGVYPVSLYATNPTTGCTDTITHQNYFYSSTQTVNSYATAGTTSWTVPCGVTSVNVECWGGGGGGGGAKSFNDISGYGYYFGAGGGGGGGAYNNFMNISVSPGDICSIVVGAGGLAGTAAVTNGGNGGSSSFKVNGVTKLQATGGFGGKGATIGSMGSYMGIGGTYGSGMINGGAGGPGFSGSVYTNGGGGGGGAGNVSNGSDGGFASGGRVQQLLHLGVLVGISEVEMVAQVTQ